MDERTLRQDQIARYLEALELSQQEPSLPALTRLVRAHLEHVPFENVSKLYYAERFGLKELPGLDRFLEGLHLYHFGGTCYANNYYLNRLLLSLGYDVRLCGADMSNPDVHIVNIVQLDGKEYLIDGGYAAPFLRPLLRDAAQDQVIELGRDRYQLRVQDEHGNSRMELYRDGLFKHAYTAKPAPRRIEEFASVIASSFRPVSTFMNALLIARFSGESSMVLHNQSIIRSHGRESHIRVLADRSAMLDAVEEHFLIPRAIAEEATVSLRELRDAWG